MQSYATELEGRFSSVTSRLSPAELAAFARALGPVDLPAGAALIREGEPSDRLCLLTQGSLVVTIRVSGVERELGRLSPGAIVGEVSVMDPGPASATVTADGASRVLVLSAGALDEFAASQPNVATAILHALCNATADRIATADERCGEIIRHNEVRASLESPAPPGGFFEYFRVLFGQAGK